MNEMELMQIIPDLRKAAKELSEEAEVVKIWAEFKPEFDELLENSKTSITSLATKYGYGYWLGVLPSILGLHKSMGQIFLTYAAMNEPDDSALKGIVWGYKLCN